MYRKTKHLEFKVGFYDKISLGESRFILLYSCLKYKRDINKNPKKFLSIDFEYKDGFY